MSGRVGRRTRGGKARISDRYLRSTLAVCGGALLLCLPAIANGFPFMFYDTLHYFAVGKKIVGTIAEALHIPMPPEPLPPGVNPAMREAVKYSMYSYLGGRSPYYGVPFYALCKMFGGWGPAVAQAFVGAWLVWLYTKLLDLRARTYFEIIAYLTLASALPWTAMFLMPDVFGGYAIITAAALVFWWDKLGLPARIACFAILTASAAFHGINLLLVIAALPLALLVLWLIKRPRGDFVRAGGVLSAAIVIALVAGAAYPMAAKALGKELRTPPFLTARVLADGPGRVYLRKACANETPYELCRFKNLELKEGNLILWSVYPQRGIYMSQPPAVQRKLIEEQIPFVWAVATHETIPQIGASLRNWGMQLISFDVSDLSLLGDGWKRTAAAGSIDETLMPWMRTPAVDHRYPLWLFTLFEQIGFVAAIGFLIFRLTRADFRAPDDERRTFLALVTFALGLVILNAGIAGALSGVFHRYQARVVWIAPLAALLAIYRFGLNPRRADAGQATASMLN